MHLALFLLIVVLAAVGFLVIQLVYLSAVLAWEDQRTRGTSYYGLPSEERDRFKRSLRRHAALLTPILRLMGRFTKPDLARASFRFEGISGPKGTCTIDSFARGAAYGPESSDLLRGGGDLVESDRTLYSVSPWLESVKSVAVADAPVLGSERPSRVIKTHFPAHLCPFDPAAKYIYVARHPVSCFASCADFLAENLGPFCPDLDAIEKWFCSDELMWWGTWPAHVEGWWALSQQEDNVLAVTFEEMKQDLGAVARRIAGFLELAPLTDAELQAVLVKCGFGYMREHATAFEMHPPHILAFNSRLFVRGTADRHRDVSAETGQRIMAWCEERMARGRFPLSDVYPPARGVGGKA